MKRRNYIHGRRLAFGLGLGVIAIAVAFGSSASARSLITGADVKNGSLTGADIKSRSIALSDLTLRARVSLRGQQGLTGPIGVKGSTGATGVRGAPGPVAGAIPGPQGDPGAAGAKGAPGTVGPQGASGTVGPQGAPGTNGAKGDPGVNGAKGDPGANGAKGDPGANGAKGAPGFSPTAFGPYASDSPDSGICGNDWANDKMDRSYVVYPQADGSVLVAETFTNGTFTTLAGDSPMDSACNAPADNLPAGITGTLKGYFLVQIPAAEGNFDPEATCTVKCYTKEFVQAFFGTANYDVPVFELHYAAPGHGNWKNASDNRGGNSGNITS